MRFTMPGRDRTTLAALAAAISVATITAVTVYQPAPPTVVSLSGATTAETASPPATNPQVPPAPAPSTTPSSSAPATPTAAPSPSVSPTPPPSPTPTGPLAKADDPGPYTRPDAHVLQPGDDNSQQPILTVTFTTTQPMFIHIVAFGSLTTDGTGRCDGSTLVSAGHLYAVLDTIVGADIISIGDDTLHASGTASKVSWIVAGMHTLSIGFGSQGCWRTAAGTTVVEDLHVQASAVR